MKAYIQPFPIVLAVLLTGCTYVKPPVATQCFGVGCSNANIVKANLKSSQSQIDVPVSHVTSPDVKKTNLEAQSE